jgi:hypothetical protein
MSCYSGLFISWRGCSKILLEFPPNDVSHLQWHHDAFIVPVTAFLPLNEQVPYKERFAGQADLESIL